MLYTTRSALERQMMTRVTSEIVVLTKDYGKDHAEETLDELAQTIRGAQ